MKGLKSLAATVLGVALLASAAPATAGVAAYKHYVGCGVSEHTAEAHTCPRKSKKGAFFESLNGDVFYTVCVKFPTGKNLCAQKTGSDQRDAVREQDHLPTSRQTQGDLVCQQQARRLLLLHSREVAPRWSSLASTPRPAIPPSVPAAGTRRCTSRCWASPRRAGPSTPRCCWGRSSGRRRRPEAGTRST